MSNADGTYTCAHADCNCEVADDETHIRSTEGQIYCSEGCRDGSGCRHPGCNCAQSSA